MPTIRTACRFLPALPLLLSCGGSDLVLPSEGEPAAVTIVQGDAQSGRVGAPLAQPVVARVTDSQGRPVTDVPVAFAFMGGIAATVAPDTAATDADGRASFQLMLGPEVGQGSGEVRVRSAGGSRTLSEPVRFAAVSADANELVEVSGDSQSAPVGGTLPDPLVVRVTDGFGNPVAGVDVTWTAPEGGSASQAIVPTGPDGSASVQVTLGTNAGLQYTTAGAPGLAGSPVTFTHTALPGAATTLERVSGDGQSALVGTSLPDQLVVRARDAGGNPVAGLGVTWVVTAGNGSVAPQNGATGDDGLATTRWTLGPSPGANALTAVISGVGTVGFAATGTPGTPPGLSIQTQPPAAAVRGVALGRAPVVQLREPDGSVSPQAGVPVSVAVATAGGTLRGTLTRTTGPDGRAGFPGLVLEGPPGSYALAFSAPGHTGAASGGIALARAPTTTDITADEPDPSPAGAAVRVAFRVRSPGGTPLGTVRVSADDGTGCTASVIVGACSLALTGPGSRTLTASFDGSTEFEGSAGTDSHEVRAPLPPALALAVQPPPSATVGAPFGTDPVVQLRDAGGNDLHTGGVVVAVAVASGGGGLGGATTSTTGPDGRAAFPGLSIGGATGPHTLRFTADGYTSVTSDPIDVEAAPPAETSTSITADEPDPSDVGQPVTVRFSVTSSTGAPGGTVTVTASGGSEQCSGTVAQGSCALTLTSAGTRTLTASYAGEGGFAGSTGATEHSVREPPPVPSATASSVAVADATIPAGGSTSVIVTVRDAGGAALPGVSVTLTATGSDNEIDPSAATTDGNGVARFTFGSGSAGPKTLTAVADGVTIAQRPTVTVQAAALPRLALHKQPSSIATTGQPLRQQPEIELEDAGGKKLPRGGVVVTASLASENGTLSGTVTSTTDPNGRAEFEDLGITGPTGTYAIQFSAAGFTPVTSNPILLLAPLGGSEAGP